MGTAIYRAQTICSMLRPAFLRDARHALRSGTITSSAFKKIEDRAVDDALAIQERAGVDLVTDGEQRRASFLGSLLETTEGLTRNLSITKPWHEDDEHVAELSLGLAVTGKVRRRRSLATEEFVYARARARRPIKMTLPSPMMLKMFWSPQESAAAYRDPFEMFADGAAVIREVGGRVGKAMPGQRRVFFAVKQLDFGVGLRVRDRDGVSGACRQAPEADDLDAGFGWRHLDVGAAEHRDDVERPLIDFARLGIAATIEVDEHDPAAIDEVRDLSRVLNELQERTMRVRMVPVATITDGLQRAVRDVSRSTGKDVRWEVRGEDTELDRSVHEKVSDALVHLVRNAVDHGMEDPDRRRAAGKPILTGPIDSVRWEMLRKGIEDYEYLWLLRERLQQARARGVPRRLLARDEALLAVPPEIALNVYLIHP